MSNNSQNTGKRLARNTAFMYFRMLFLLAISFYTARVILQQLGVDDYGIYNLVGSILVMFSSLRTLFSASTQRFLNYEMGRGNNEKLQLVFNLSIYINLAICVVFFILVEAIGMWFLIYKANIAPCRLAAAIWVFQFSVVASLLSILVTSYDALIIAHEKMDFFAYISILEGVMKLVVIFMLSWFNSDKLILYGFLLFCVSIIILAINWIYCVTQFPESKFKKCWDKEYLKQMTTFAGWNFFGKTSYALTQSGINMVLNMFGGAVVNAARGIAFQLNAATNQFLNNINIVLSPYCIKLYAEGDREKFDKMLFLSTKIFFYVQLCLVIPLYFLGENVLQIWLGQVPEYSVGFLRLILIWSLIRSVHAPLDNLFKAHGNLKLYQLAEGLILLVPVLLGWMSLKLGYSYNSVFVIINIIEFINFICISFIAKRIAGLSLYCFLKSAILPCLYSVLPVTIMMLNGSDSIVGLFPKIFECLLLFIASTAILYFVGLDKCEKGYIKDLVSRKI